jgi:hypothetical protein
MKASTAETNTVVWRDYVRNLKRFYTQKSQPVTRLAFLA